MAQEYLKVLIAAQNIRKDYSRDEMQEFLTAVNRVISLEHECDEALRLTEKTIIFESTDYKELRVYFEIARIIEEATNSLMKSVYIMHDTILEGMNR
jgi:ABC-type proline/glycine betaine transport system ATPase subunit